jgi:nucleotide-binding universal stress UspA family protein
VKRFKRILLVPVAGRSEAPRALSEAATLATQSGAEVDLLGLLDEPPAALRNPLVEALTARLAEWADEVGRPSMSVDVAVGPQAENVAAAVRRGAHDLVVIAADRDDESLTRAQRIVRLAPCPVWVIRPGFTGERVLAAVDPDHEPDLTRLVLELAASEAERHHGVLRVMHAWEVDGLGLLDRADPPLSAAERSRIVASLEEHHRLGFEAALEDVGLAPGPQTHLVDGAPARAIGALTDLYRVDLVVLGAGRSDDRLGLGSTAEQVVTTTPASVLVVRESQSSPS